MSTSHYEPRYAQGQDSELNLNPTAVNPRLHELSDADLFAYGRELFARVGSELALNYAAAWRNVSVPVGETE